MSEHKKKLKCEIYRDVKGYEGLYKVNALGEVFSVKRNKMLSETVDKHGYVKYCLTKDGTHRQVKAHRIVAEAFIPNPQNRREVNHIDGDKSNNAVWNLCVRICVEYEHKAFIDGFHYGAQLMTELQEN